MLDISQGTREALLSSAIDLLCRYFSMSSSSGKYGIDKSIRVEPFKFGHQVNSDTHLQTVEIQMRRRRLLMSRLIRIFTVRLVNLFLVPIIEL